jgi:hypothetical protein
MSSVGMSRFGVSPVTREVIPMTEDPRRDGGVSAKRPMERGGDCVERNRRRAGAGRERSGSPLRAGIPCLQPRGVSPVTSTVCDKSVAVP